MEKNSRSIEKNAILVIAALFLLFALKAMKGVIIPIACSLFIYLVFYPYIEKLKTEYHWKHFAVVILFTFILLAIIIIFLLATLYVLDKIVSTLPEYVKMADWALDRLNDYIGTKFNNEDWIAKASGPITDGSSSYITNASTVFADYIKGNWLLAKELFNSILLIFIYDFFLLLEHERIKKTVVKMVKSTRQKIAIEMTIRQVSRYLVAKFIVSLATGIVFAIILLAFRMDGWFIWATLTFIFNFIPTIGSVVITLLVALFAVLQFGLNGQIWIALTIALLCTMTQFIIGNIIDPKLTGNKVKISPIMILVSIAIWGFVFGIVGMIIAVPATCMIKNLVKYSDLFG